MQRWERAGKKTKYFFLSLPFLLFVSNVFTFFASFVPMSSRWHWNESSLTHSTVSSPTRNLHFTSKSVIVHHYVATVFSFSPRKKEKCPCLGSFAWTKDDGMLRMGLSLGTIVNYRNKTKSSNIIYVITPIEDKVRHRFCLYKYVAWGSRFPKHQKCAIVLMPYEVWCPPVIEISHFTNHTESIEMRDRLRAHYAMPTCLHEHNH